MTKKIEFTDQAIKQINKIVLENSPKKYFRISVLGGGCSGFKYNFTFDDKLEVEIELWDIWQELAGKDLPLPLGGMCLRRSIPLNKAIDYENTLIKAVKVATDNKLLLSDMLLERDLIRVDHKTLQTYLDLYATIQFQLRDFHHTLK